jgi:RNA polymerase sigma factor (sigma-70 family)
MTDFEIIEALIARDNRVTQEFFFERCRSLFYAIIHKVFDYEVDYDEFVNELYIYLMENDATRLKQFEGRSSLYQWLKVTATRFFIKKRDQLIEDCSKETPIEEESMIDHAPSVSALDVQRLMDAMPNKRYVHVIRKLIIEEYSPEELAAEMHITTDNLYNIKRRAMMQLMQVALNDIRAYGKK